MIRSREIGLAMEDRDRDLERLEAQAKRQAGAVESYVELDDAYLVAPIYTRQMHVRIMVRSKHGLHLSAEAYRALGNPEYVRVYLPPKALQIVASRRGDPDAFRCSKCGKGSVRLGGTQIVERCGAAGWPAGQRIAVDLRHTRDGRPVLYARKPEDGNGRPA